MKLQSWASRPPCPGLMVTNGIAVIELTGKPARKLKLIDGTGQALSRGCSLLAKGDGVGVIPHLLGKLQRGAGIGKLAARGVHGSDIFLGTRDLLHGDTGGVGVTQKPGATLLASSSVTRVRFSSKWRYDSDLGRARSANASSSAGVTSKASAINDSCRGST